MKTIKKYDKSDMLATLEAFPDQCMDAKSIGMRFSPPASLKLRYKNVVSTGLGGSAIGGDIARSYIANLSKIPIFVNRNYTLPAFVDGESLVIASSYSGNTEETLSAYKDAKKKGAKIVVISSGGQLTDLASADGFPVITIPKGLQPRCALGYSFIPILFVLSKLDIIPDPSGDIDEMVGVLRKIKDKNNAERIAEDVYLKYPIIYAGQDLLDSAATRWRGQFAENAKTLSSSHVFPEMNHNEIVGWENPAKILKNFVAIILRDSKDHPRILKRIKITKSILTKAGFKVITLDSIGSGRLARIFSVIYTGDFVSFYLAILNGVDPTPVDRISFLKKEMERS